MKELEFDDFINNYESSDPLKLSDEFKKQVTDILNEVKLSQDNALISFSKKFDNVVFSSPESFKFKKKDFKNSYEKLDKNIIENLEYLKERIVKFHSKRLIRNWKDKDSAFNE